MAANSSEPGRRVAALPAAIAQDGDQLDDAAPGHRFWLYLRQWDEASDGQLDVAKKERAAALGEACRLPAASQGQLAALLGRQDSLMRAIGQAGCTLDAVATAPLVTGLGLPHPTGNGFAFLSPYGLPYLPGSGTKGVVRAAAERLVLDNPCQDLDGWTWADLWWLFGFEGSAGALWDKNDPTMGNAFLCAASKLASQPDLQAMWARLHQMALPGKALPSADRFAQQLLGERSFREAIHLCGALQFWDAFAQPRGHTLMVEVMTRHHEGYLQRGEAPHEAEQAVPVTFLALPPGSRLRFHVRCALDRLPDGLRRQDRWRALLHDAFEHAFDVLGFGAKTAVGYGALRREEPAGSEQIWRGARLHYLPGRDSVRATLSQQATAPLTGQGFKALLDDLGAERAARLLKKHELGPLDVWVWRQANLVTLLGLARSNAD